MILYKNYIEIYRIIDIVFLNCMRGENYGSGKKNINTAICANMLRNFILYAFRYG